MEQCVDDRPSTRSGGSAALAAACSTGIRVAGGSSHNLQRATKNVATLHGDSRDHAPCHSHVNGSSDGFFSWWCSRLSRLSIGPRRSFASSPLHRSEKLLGDLEGLFSKKWKPKKNGEIRVRC